MSNKVSLNELISVLGQPEKRQGTYYYWQCPSCNDNSRDNLVFNEQVAIFMSHCCLGKGSKEVYAKIMQARKTTNQPVVIKRTQEEIVINHWANISRLNENTKAQNYFFKKRGISPQAQDDLQIGLTVDKRWSFPISNKDEMAGFEFRDSLLLSGKEKNITKELIQHNFLASIIHEEAKKLIVLEGFIDAYSFYEYLLKRGMQYDYHIMCVVNGCQDLPKLINTIKSYNYDEIIILFDNDERGRDAVAKASEVASFRFKRLLVPCDCCKDMNEFLLKHPKDNLF